MTTEGGTGTGTKPNRAARRARRKPETQSKAFRAAVAAANENGKGPTDEVVLKNGVHLKLKPVPPLLVRKAVANIIRPEVPRADIGKGREEDNPADPAYDKAMGEYAQATFDAGANVMLAMGVEVLHVPKGIHPLDSDDWVDELTASGFAPDVKTAAARRLSWVSYYAITSEEDVIRVVLGVSRLTGVPESEVAAVMDSFRSGEVRGGDSEVPAEAD